MNKWIIYGHGGCQNHGNEAILRGFKAVMEDGDFQVYSYNPQADIGCGIQEIYDVRSIMRTMRRFTPAHILRYIYRHAGLHEKMAALQFKPLIGDIEEGHTYLLEAGDQYCEPNENGIRRWYMQLNSEIIKRGGKTAMLFCTIPTNILAQESLIEDLKRYSLVIAREHITYNALCKAGLRDNVIYSPCCAFMMPPRECDLHRIFSLRKMVGLTIGTLAQGNERYNDRLKDSVVALIKFILNQTKYGVALIPHIKTDGDPDDVAFLHDIASKFVNERVQELPERRADEQKYIISNCEMLVTVRTHASIAAYSSCVPAMVIGYSQKSIGIAQDLFGTKEHYVLNVAEACDEKRLITNFMWFDENRNSIREHLTETLPEYLAPLKQAKAALEILVNE